MQALYGIQRGITPFKGSCAVPLRLTWPRESDWHKTLNCIFLRRANQRVRWVFFWLGSNYPSTYSYILQTCTKPYSSMWTAAISIILTKSHLPSTVQRATLSCCHAYLTYRLHQSPLASSCSAVFVIYIIGLLVWLMVAGHRLCTECVR